jgi:hypothetical protein
MSIVVENYPITSQDLIGLDATQAHLMLIKILNIIEDCEDTAAAMAACKCTCERLTIDEILDNDNTDSTLCP